MWIVMITKAVWQWVWKNIIRIYLIKIIRVLYEDLFSQKYPIIIVRQQILAQSQFPVCDKMSYIEFFSLWTHIFNGVFNKWLLCFIKTTGVWWSVISEGNSGKNLQRYTVRCFSIYWVHALLQRTWKVTHFEFFFKVL